MAYIPASGSVVTFQSDPTKLVATISVVSVVPTSVSGTVGASIIGLTPIAVTNIPSVSGTVNVGNLPTTQNISGSVAAFQGGTRITSLVSTVPSSVLVGASIIGLTPVSIAGIPQVEVVGSVAAQMTPAANQSVSGTVGASLIGTAPVKLESSNASVITLTQGSVAVAIISGSVAVATGNSSVMLLNSGNAIGSVTTLQGTNPWIITGSVQGSFSPSGNQSVSGTVGASVIGTVPVTQTTNPWIITGSIQGGGAGTQYAEDDVVGSVTGTAIMFRKSQDSSIMEVVNPGAPLPVSVQGTINISGNPSISGTVNIGGTANVNTAGSVVAFQGTTPWIIGSIYGNISGSVAATISNTNLNVGGSVIAFPTGNQSVSGTVGASIVGIGPVTLTANTIPASALAFLGATTSITAANSSIITVTGYPTATLQITSNPSMTATILFEGSADNSSWVPITGYNQATTALSSVTTVADSNWAFNVAGLQTFRARLAAWTAGSITGKVYLSPVDARPTTNYVAGNPSISGTVGASMVGQLPAGTAALGSIAALQGTLPWTISSVYGNISGSVAAFVVGNASLITLNQGSSILAVPVGSTITIQQANSIVGTYAEDAGHTSADKGIFTLMVRNDTMSSITSADTDYSPHVVDAQGRTVIKPFTGNDGTLIEYTGSVVSTSVTLIQASAVGKKSYITDFWFANTGSVATLVTFQDGSTSVLGYTIVPAGGGSNSQGINLPHRTANAQDLAFKVSTSTSVLYATVRGYQAQ